MSLLIQWLPLTLPIWLPFLVAPLVYLLRRQALPAALLGAATLAVVALWLVLRPPIEPMALLGRPLGLSELGRGLLVLLAGWLAFALLFFARIPQGWTAFPVLLLVYGLLAAALFNQQLVISVIILKLAWLVMILLVQAGAATNTRAATRLLVLTVLALPSFLIAATLIEQQSYQPDLAVPITWIALMLGLSFALMLAVVPFHAWLPQVAEDGPPLIAAWLVAGMGGSYLVILFELLGRYSWLAHDEQFLQALFAAGVLLVVFGGLLALSENHLGRLWSYVGLIDLGYILLALSINSTFARAAALFAIGTRMLSLLLSGSALAALRHHATSLHFSALRGLGSRFPLTILAFGFGTMALIGVPLTASFPSHWAILRLLTEQNNLWLWAVVIASVLGVAAVLRAFLVIMSPAEQADDRLETVTPESPVVVALLMALTLFSIFVGTAPQRFNVLIDFFVRSANF